MQFGSPFNFVLHCLPLFHRDDGFVGILCQVAGALSGVFEHPLCYVVFAEGCLQEKVSRITVVSEHFGNGLRMPYAAVHRCRDTVLI